uniref:Nectin cell adhesion molecule 2 n=1 Tax=Oryzias latipes TaxID=8090 RepID=A0A3P9J3W5_ORYLA
MARHDAQNWPESTKMIGLLCFVASILTQHGILGQRVKVDPEVMSYPGQSVNLRCSFSDPTGVQLTMVTWIYESKDGLRNNIAVLHPSYDPNYPESSLKGRVSFQSPQPEMTRPSIQIADLRMSDEGKYICEYATYPSGNEQGTTQLIMLAKPENSASTVSVEAGTQTTTVAKCESANGLPAAKISWVTTAKGNETTTTKAGTDNTVTVSSEYRMVPTPSDNGKDISCVVDHRTLEKPESFKMKLAVLFAPEVSISGYDNNWYMGRTSTVLICEAKANPVPTSVLWKTMSGEMPDTVLISGNQLKVLKVDETVNTTFVCEVKNRLGTSKSQVTIVVREPSQKSSNAGVVAGIIIGVLLALLLLCAIVAVLVTRNRRQQQGYRAKGGSDLKTRMFGGGKKASKNGTGGGAGSGGTGGGNNNGSIFVYNDGSSHQGLPEKNNHHQPLNMGPRPGVVASTPTAQDILLRNELDEAEIRKFDDIEDEERYDHFSGAGPILQLRSTNDQENMIGGYLDDDMESQRDGSVISRTAVYV